MSQHEITREDINALLEFLPLFEKPGRTFVKWSEIVKNALTSSPTEVHL